MLLLRTLLVCCLLLLAGCSDNTDPDVDPDQVDSVAPPEVGACRMLDPDDVAGKPSNATRTVDCTEPHNAETFAVGPLPPQFDEADYDSPDLGRFAYFTCEAAFQRYLGADESLSMRTIVSWSWFRPSENAWDDGARWYRCDAVGGGEAANVMLPTTVKGLLLGQPDARWMKCAAEADFANASWVPCSEKHAWRAVTTIKLGEPDDPYPGDRLVAVKTDQYCSSSVHAWLGYPAADYEYAKTWYHEAEWQAGNRRSICWAKTDK